MLMRSFLQDEGSIGVIEFTFFLYIFQPFGLEYLQCHSILINFMI